MRIPIDIETIPTQSPERLEVIRQRTIAAAHEAQPPANYKREEAIARWREEQVDAAEDAAREAHHATALDGSWGEVVCICWWSEKRGEMMTHERSERDEADLLREFAEDMRNELAGQAATFVGYNVQFDLRFLHHRYVLHGIRPGFHIPYNDPPWRSSYVDLRTEWYGTQARGGTKLTDLCEAFGIVVDDTITGADVAACWDAGDIDIIVRHCQADVERVRELYSRMVP